MEFNQAELDHFRNSHKAHSTKKRESRVWGTLRNWDVFAFFLYAVAFLLLLTSIFLFVLPNILLLAGEIGMAALLPPALLLFSKTTLFQIATGTFIASVLLMLLARWRVLHNRALRPECGCPNCQERELIRVPRKRRDRMFSLVGVTAWRYSCRNCTWGGLRVGGQRPLPVQQPKEKAPVLVTEATTEMVIAEDTEMDSLDAVFETVAYESDAIIETVPMVEIENAAAEDEVVEEVVVVPAALVIDEEIELVAELPIDDFEETAVDEAPIPEPQESISPDEEPLIAAPDDRNIFDSEFERLCYEAAQAK